MRPGRGRKPKPTELIKLLGNPGKRKMRTGMPQVDKLYNVPSPPEHLNEIAKERWGYLAGRLVKCGILADIDVDTLEICCTTLAIARMAAQEIDKNKMVLVLKNEDGTVRYAQKTPYMNVMLDALGAFDKFGSKLGLSPSDRERLKGIGKKEEDEFDEFLKTGKAANA